MCFFFFSSRRRHTRYWRDWSSDVCSSDLHHLGKEDRHECGPYRAEAQALARRFVAGPVGPTHGNGPWAGGSSANSRTGSVPEHGAGQVAAHYRRRTNGQTARGGGSGDTGGDRSEERRVG